ncbi:MAG: dTDP-4-dehydrorhamnose reductase [Bacteroidales bacterium]|nr:dTDP-4-dehydrorhamnose reductase [Candidatus Sodaliphilus aphodohippi]
MKILITGANGQLGNEMRIVLGNHHEHSALFTDIEELDLTQSDAVSKFVANNNIDIIVNCAAYTAVDSAEDNPELCHKINVEAVRNLATASREYGARIIHISTDYVFDGSQNLPYNETTQTCPKSVYGRTKLEGERILLETSPDSIVIRTAWLYSPFGKNFVKTMIKLGQEKDSLKVVYDQVGTPTYARDLARAIVTIINSDNWVSGIYHFTNEGVTSWFDFTKAIHRIAGINSCTVMPCRTDEFPTKASRPSYSVLDKSKIKSTFSVEVPYWEESLKDCIKRLQENIY